MWSRLAALKVFICVGPWLAQTVTWLAFFFLLNGLNFVTRGSASVSLSLFFRTREISLFEQEFLEFFQFLANFVWCVLGRTVASGWMNATVVEWTKLAKVWLSQPVSLSFAQPKSADFCFFRRPKLCKKKVVDSSDTCVPSTNTLKDVSQDNSSSTNVPFWVCECRKAGPATRSGSFPKKKKIPFASVGPFPNFEKFCCFVKECDWRKNLKKKKNWREKVTLDRLQGHAWQWERETAVEKNSKRKVEKKAATQQVEAGSLRYRSGGRQWRPLIFYYYHYISLKDVSGESESFLTLAVRSTSGKLSRRWDGGAI